MRLVTATFGEEVNNMERATVEGRRGGVPREKRGAFQKKSREVLRRGWEAMQKGGSCFSSERGESRIGGGKWERPEGEKNARISTPIDVVEKNWLRGKTRRFHLQNDRGGRATRELAFHTYGPEGGGGVGWRGKDQGRENRKKAARRESGWKFIFGGAKTDWGLAFSEGRKKGES